MKKFAHPASMVHKLSCTKFCTARQASRQWGGQCPPDFRFCPPIFSCPPTVFFWEEVEWFWAEKALKFAISARKIVRILAKTFFFWRSPAFGRKICNFGPKKPSDFGEDLFFFFFEITCFRPEKSLNFWFRSENPLEFQWRPFFLEITCFRPEKLFNFWFQSENPYEFLVFTLFIWSRLG